MAGGQQPSGFFVSTGWDAGETLVEIGDRGEFCRAYSRFIEIY